MVRLRIPALNNGAVITSIMALLSSSVFMGVTGGGLKSYEARALSAAIASLLGDEAAARTLEEELAGPRVRLVHLVPTAPIALPGPPIDVDVALLGADLLGGPSGTEAPLRVVPVVAREPQQLPPLAPPADDKCMNVEEGCAMAAQPAATKTETAAVSTAAL